MTTSAGEPADVPELLTAAHPDLTREHYLPIDVGELGDALYAELPLTDRPHWRALLRILSATVHHGLHERQEQLLRDYSPFDPDCDFVAREPVSAEAEAGTFARLFDDFRHLLIRANFVQLAQEDIDEALDAASDWGVSLHVDTSCFERLEVFARGDCVTRRVRRSWLNLYRVREIEVPTFQRLAVIFRLKEGVDASLHSGHKDHHPVPVTEIRPVFVKLFKNVPKMDVDMLLPGTRVKMSWMDQGRIMLPTLSGLALAAVKIAKGAVIFTFVSVYGTLAFLGFVGGTLAYGLKSFFGYLQTKDKYHLHLTRSLYYQNLDNNAGVFTRLLYEAEQQEIREAVLGYALLRSHAVDGGVTSADLDRHVEAWLQARLGTLIDFEIHDALRKLVAWGLVTRLPGDRYVAVPADEACRHLDKQWDAWFTPTAPPPAPSERVA
jgi:hypothetical protein